MDNVKKLINKNSLGIEAAAIIRSRIIDGTYSFGERLIEDRKR